MLVATALGVYTGRLAVEDKISKEGRCSAWLNSLLLTFRVPATENSWPQVAGGGHQQTMKLILDSARPVITKATNGAMSWKFGTLVIYHHTLLSTTVSGLELADYDCLLWQWSHGKATNSVLLSIKEGFSHCFLSTFIGWSHGTTVPLSEKCYGFVAF